MSAGTSEKRRLGARIREARLGLSLSQAELARAVGMTVESISRAERGTITPTIWTLLEICRALDTNLSALAGEQVASSGELPPKLARAVRLMSKVSDEELDAIIRLLELLDRKASRKSRSPSR